MKIVHLLALALFTWGCKSIGSNVKDLTITDEKGIVEDTNVDEILRIPVYLGATSKIKLFVTGRANALAKFVVEDGAGDHEINPVIKFDGNASPKPPKFILANAVNHDTGTEIPGKAELNALCPIEGLDGKELKNIRGVNLVGSGSPQDAIRLCYRDQTCHVNVVLNKGAPILEFDFQKGLNSQDSSFVFFTENGAFIQAAYALFKIGGDPARITLLVDKVIPGSPAAASGLAPNDGIFSINGKDVSFGSFKSGLDITAKVDAFLSEPEVNLGVLNIPDDVIGRLDNLSKAYASAKADPNLVKIVKFK